MFFGRTVYHADGKTGQKLENQGGNTDFQNFSHDLFRKAALFDTEIEHALFPEYVVQINRCGNNLRNCRCNRRAGYAEVQRVDENRV